jgi:glycosyltransferase involved in cell wall biosynthesis
VVLCAVWALFLLQAFSGRSALSWLRYQRLRQRLLRGRDPARGGARRTIAGPEPVTRGPRIAWSHDGWAEADNNLVGLGLLNERYDVVAFGTEGRQRGAPPVRLELLPAQPYDEGLMLKGLTEMLGSFDVAWTCGTFEGTTLQALDARAAGGPAVVCYEWENVVANYGHVSHPARARAVREVDHFCASSSAARAVLELDGVEPERITVVPPPVEVPSYDHAELATLRGEGRREWGLDDDATVLLFMGRAVWQKGLHTIAAAAATLARRPEGEHIRWLIAGDGDYLPEFERIVAHYGAADAVRTLGTVSGRDRHRAYAAADGLVLPSMPTPRWLEQFGRVIPEAFAFGLPVIGSASGAIPEVVGDAGIIVAPGDHLALAAAAVRLTDAGHLATLRAAALRRLADDYSVARYVERVTDAIERAIRSRSVSRSSG